MRIFLACGDERLKIALLMLLENEPGTVVAGISDRTQGLFSQVAASQPDALVFSLEESIPVIAGQITNIHNLTDPPVIIYLSSKAEEKETILAAGADHFILKDSPPDDVLTILRNIRTRENPPPDH